MEIERRKIEIPPIKPKIITYKITYTVGDIRVSNVPTYKGDLCIGSKWREKKARYPPAPKFGEISKNYENMVVCGLIFDLESVIKSIKKPRNFTFYYLTVDRAFKRRIHDMSLAIEKVLGGCALGEGACNLCRPCKYLENG